MSEKKGVAKKVGTHKSPSSEKKGFPKEYKPYSKVSVDRKNVRDFDED